MAAVTPGVGTMQPSLGPCDRPARTGSLRRLRGRCSVAQRRGRGSGRAWSQVLQLISDRLRRRKPRAGDVHELLAVIAVALDYLSRNPPAGVDLDAVGFGPLPDILGIDFVG